MTERPAVEPSARLVDQRVRNRVIEYLELASSFEEQLTYERVAPIANIPYEVINQWEDWAHYDPRDDPAPPHVYSGAEIDAMRAFQGAWDKAASALPDDYPSVADTQSLPEWVGLRDAGAAALSVFMLRGRLPEDHEVQD